MVYLRMIMMMIVMMIVMMMMRLHLMLVCACLASSLDCTSELFTPRMERLEGEMAWSQTSVSWSS